MSSKAKPKLNLLQQFKQEYSTPKSPRLLEIGPAKYCVVRGHGAPGSELFQERLGALYAIVYTLKFASKDAGRDFVVSKLEGLYGVDGQELDQLQELPPERWNWRLMIRVPEFATQDDLSQAVRTLREKGKEGDFEGVSLETYDEGSCIQMLHVGAYEDEERTLAEMRAFAESEGWAPHLWHHEIYLSDPRRVPAERLRTILRQPVVSAVV